MPLFSSASSFDADVEKATSEMNTGENWGLFLDICDRARQSSSASKDCLKSIIRRLNDRVPFVAIQALSLLNACVKNCGHVFHLEIASRDFINECKSLIGERAHPKVSMQLKLLIKSWSENEFKNDSSLILIPSFCTTLKSEGHSFETDEIPKTRVFSKDPNVVSSQEEEEDIAKAIALSMKEIDKQKNKSSSLYPNFVSNSAASSFSSQPKTRDPRKVQALYDFEAVEDNELTFKAGEIIGVIDDSDPNWWKGVSWRGEGLFPANFVSPDLNQKLDSTIEIKEDEIKKSTEERTEDISFVQTIDEEKIDETLAMIQNADPTGERCPDPQELYLFEEQCRCMGPLIDQELEKIDRNHGTLMDLNSKVMEALQLYHNLMRELPSYGYTTTTTTNTMVAPSVSGYNIFPQPPPPPSYVSLNQVFQSQPMLSLSEIPQGIAAQVGSSSFPPNQMPTHTIPSYQPQSTIPQFYDLATQYSTSNSQNIANYGPSSLPPYNSNNTSGYDVSNRQQAEGATQQQQQPMQMQQPRLV